MTVQHADSALREQEDAIGDESLAVDTAPVADRSGRDGATPEVQRTHLEDLLRPADASGESPAGAHAVLEPGEPAPPLSMRIRRPLVIGSAVLVLILAILAGTILAMTKRINITVDGQSQTVTTLAGTVGSALNAAGIELAAHDTLAPGLDQSVADGSLIVIGRSRLLTLTIDDQETPYWTTAGTLDEAMSELGRDPRDYLLSADRTREIPLEGLAVTADTLYGITVQDRGVQKTIDSVSMTVGEFLEANDIMLGENDRLNMSPDLMVKDGTQIQIYTLPSVQIVDGGGQSNVIVSEATTVSMLLAQAGVVLGPLDVVSVPLDAPLTDGLQIDITRVVTTRVITKEPIEQPAAQSVDDPQLLKGTSKVVQEGNVGEVTILTEITTTNGAESARVEISRSASVEAKPTITNIGTKLLPPPPVVKPPPPAANTPVAPPAAAPPTPVPGITWDGNRVFFNDFEYGVNWDGLAKCESGNNPKAVSSNGKWTGLFQFDDRTWRGVGGSGRASEAPPEEQLMRAKMLYQSRGLGPWACAYAAR